MDGLKDYIRLHEMYKKKQYRKLIYTKLRNFENNYNNYLSLFNKKKYEIVIAKYNEDISWSYPYKHLTTIYNKSDIRCPNSKKLSNVGRESHTYLYHIISNWDNLAETTLFTQGELSNEHQTFPVPIYFLLPNLYVSNIKEQGILFKDKDNHYLRHQGKWLNEYKNKEMKPAIISFKDFLSIFSDDNEINFGRLLWSHGAIFSVSRELIKQNSLELYIYLYKLVCNHKNPEEGHYFERSWYYIFNCGRIKENNSQ